MCMAQVSGRDAGEAAAIHAREAAAQLARKGSLLISLVEAMLQ